MNQFDLLIKHIIYQIEYLVVLIFLIIDIPKAEWYTKLFIGPQPQSYCLLT